MAAPVPNLTFPAKRLLSIQLDDGLLSSTRVVAESDATKASFLVALVPRVLTPRMFYPALALLAITNDTKLKAPLKKINSRLATISIFAVKRISSFPVPYFSRILITTRPVKGTLWPRLDKFGTLQDP
jgi:hypothetical protein